MVSRTSIKTVQVHMDNAQQSHRALTVLERMRQNHDAEHDIMVMQRSRHFATFYLWFMAFQALYTTLRFTLPHYIGTVWGFDDWVLCWFKIPIWFGFVQITANWTCVRCYNSFNLHSVTEDRPELRRKLWDDHPLEKKYDDLHGGSRASRLPGGSPGERDPRLLPWSYCTVCQMDKPPRAHHCPVCTGCILKRDHHCFLVGTCIGYYNQRYFIIFTFYLMMYGMLALFFAHTYMYTFFYSSAGWLDYFLPVSAYRWLVSGTLPLEMFFLLVQVYTFVLTTPLCAYYFYKQMVVVVLGKTSYEYEFNEPVRSLGSISDNFRSVFGDFWPINFLFPAGILFRQRADGTEWPGVFRFKPHGKEDAPEVKLYS